MGSTSTYLQRFHYFLWSNPLRRSRDAGTVPAPTHQVSSVLQSREQHDLPTSLVKVPSLHRGRRLKMGYSETS